MNKKLIVAIGLSFLAVGAFARPGGGHFGGRHFGGHHGYVVPHHHHYHHGGGWWGRGGRYFWPGFVGGVVGTAIGSALIAPRETVVVTQPAVVTQPVVVQQPTVVTQPVVVQQPVQQVQTVWVEGRYVDQVQANGTVVRTWQPGHYEQRTFFQ